jgi:type IV pilus assembly protein PilX
VTAMPGRSFRPHPRAESGIVLVTGLVFMLILTVVVVAILRTGSLEERMAANARNRQIALQAGEAVLRDAEATLFAAPAVPLDPFTPAGFTDACTNGFCARPAPGGTPKWKTVDWSSASATRSFASDTSNLSTSLVAAQPRYIVEVASTPIISPSAGGGLCPTVVYRITARGLGKDGSEVFVQSMYRARPTRC